MQIEEALALFVEFERSNGRSEHWVMQVQRNVRTLSRWLGEPAVIERLEPALVARFLSSDHARLKPDGTQRLVTTVNSTRTALASFLRFLSDAGHASHDAGRLIRRARCSYPPPRVLPEAELARLLATIHAAKGRAAARDAVLLGILAWTGIRISGVLALQARDIDLVAGEIDVRQGKAGRRYRAVVPSVLRASLAAHVERHGDGPLFPISRRQAAYRLQRWLRIAGITTRVSLHSLRHGTGVRLYQRSGGDLELVREALGHASVVSTQRYVVCDRDRLRTAMNG